MRVGDELVPGGLRIVDQRLRRAVEVDDLGWVEGTCPECRGTEWVRLIPAWDMRLCGACFARRLMRRGA